MVVETKWFGTIDISEDKIITFDMGIMGFEDYKKLLSYMIRREITAGRLYGSSQLMIRILHYLL